MQTLSYAGHTTVDVLRMSPGEDEPIVRSNATGRALAEAADETIHVHGADGGLAFGLDIRQNPMQTVFDPTLYRPVNATATGVSCLILSFNLIFCP